MGSNRNRPPPPRAAKPTARAQLAARPAPEPKPGKPSPARAKPAADAAPVLVVEIDGRSVAELEASEIWRAFSAHMDEHQGDLTGFAKLRGWKSVAPIYRRGCAVLVVCN